MMVHHENEFGHPYAGFHNSVTTAPCNIAISGTVLFVYAPFIIADIPLSLIADTLYLPWDLAAQPAMDREEITSSVKEHCDEWVKAMGGTPGGRQVPNEE
ncbi:MAG: YceK/YidQ family lipoprotein [Alcanivorax sp.]|uniref:YceK/YidQ family lipoprotein n=1 Tax=Alcanivorax sp. TaxID=1872427 RepID=UPI003DA7516B